MSKTYRGRFAPTPSGPLHFGSLVTAMASYLEARLHDGQWIVRIDDIDPPRVQPGATESILRCLERYGFAWDGPVLYESRRIDAYHCALHRLKQLGLVYPCVCSRAEISKVALPGLDGPVYPGTCRRAGHENSSRARALRLNVDGALVEWVDAIQGVQRRDLSHDLGDFTLYRAEHVYTFHLASAVDDADLGISHIVRGVDLLESSIRQSYVQHLLGHSVPTYAHVPVAVNAAGEKLSKQTHAGALSLETPQPAMILALEFLGQNPPAELMTADVRGIWRWAMQHWQLHAVPRLRQREIDSLSLANRSTSSGSLNPG